MKKSLKTQNNVVAVEVQSQTNSEVKAFENTQFGKIRVIMKDGEPWFIANEICQKLGLTNSRVATRDLYEDEKDVSSIYTPGGPQQMTIISESGFYKLVLKSRKPEAKQFKCWLDQEVFPNIHSQKHTVPAVPVEINNTNSEVQSFENTQFGKIRVIMKDGNPWFITKDVCECLGILRYRDAISSLYDFEKASTNSRHVEERRELSIISESGFYKLVLKSRKPEARKFQDWVTQEVLPSIRKTGSYSVNNNSQFNELTCLIKNVLEQNNKLSTQISQLAIENKEIRQENQEIKQSIQEMVPKAKFYDDVAETTQTYDMGEVAKSIKKCGRNKLIKTLKDKKVLMKNRTPYQKYVNNGMLQVVVDKNNCYTKTVATGKGLEYIHNLLEEE